MSLPKLPSSQASASTTFTSPPLDGTLSISQIFDYNATHSPLHPLFVYEESPRSIRRVLWTDVQLATHRVARLVQPSLTSRGETIAILATCDSIAMFTIIYGLIRAGAVPFPLSPRNSPGAIAHLLVTTGAKRIIISDGMRELYCSALDTLSKSEANLIEMLEMSQFDELYSLPGSVDEEIPLATSVDINSPCMILHSSGSTAWPKPITLTHLILTQWYRVPFYGSHDISSEILNIATLPMHHAAGILLSSTAIGTGMLLSVFKPVAVPKFPTPEKLLGCIQGTGASAVLTVPHFLEAFSNTPHCFDALRKLKAVMFGGGPLSKVAGDTLSRAGIALSVMYASTECGVMEVFLEDNLASTDWEYFRLSPHLCPVFVADGGSENASATNAREVQFLTCESHTPAVINVLVDGRAGYATDDLLVEHPTKKGYYKIHGRVDDQIMLSTGEKTNPGPLEAILAQSPYIAGAVFFGRARFQNGVIVLPTPGFASGITRSEEVAAYIDLIWSSVETANMYAPSHSRLFKEMIIVANSSRPFMFTSKGSINKRQVVSDYALEIDSVYAAVQVTQARNAMPIPAPHDWRALEQVTEFVRRVISGVVEVELADKDDIFLHGGDSLEAMFIIKAITLALASSGVDVLPLAQDIVFKHPTISRLACAIHILVTSPTNDTTTDDTHHAQTMLELVDKYSTGFPSHRPRLPVPRCNSPSVVLLTGTTGALGVNLLVQLVEDASVTRIYALNRRSHLSEKDISLLTRQEAALEDQGFDRTVAMSSKVVLLECDLFAKRCGIPLGRYDEIRDSVTSIIHCAWKVDFNLTLSTFEPLIKGVRHLVDLALSSPHSFPPRLLFTSSVGIFNTSYWHSRGSAPESPIEDPRTAIGMGYSESKWVGEQILNAAAKATALRPIIVRVEQLCGGKNGAWNKSELMPSIICSAGLVGCLPLIKKEIAWLPIDVAATAILDFQVSTTRTLNLGHPRPVSWNTVFEPIAENMGIPLLPYEEWLAKLEQVFAEATASGTEMQVARFNPILRLMNALNAHKVMDVTKSSHSSLSVAAVAHMDTTHAVKGSVVLGDETVLPSLGRADAIRWLSYWRRIGVLSMPLRP